MKKVLLIISIFLILTGCSLAKSSPKKEVELFLNKYQKQDKIVIEQLEDTINKDSRLNDDDKKEYKELIKKQYQDLTYEIKNEAIDGDNASVEVEINVYDYYKGIEKAKTDLIDNPDIYNDETGNIDDHKFMTKKIEEMKKIKDKVTYTLNLTLTKKDNKWKLNDLSETDRQKIHGIYNYK